MKTKWSLAFLVSLLFSLIACAADNEQSRIQQLEFDVAILKRAIIDQNKRIEELERALALLSAPASTEDEKTSPATPKIASGAAWKNPANWDRIEKGMSEDEVLAILGKPENVKEVGPFKTLLYRGPVYSPTAPTGTIVLSNDRVWKIEKPGF